MIIAVEKGRESSVIKELEEIGILKDHIDTSLGDVETVLGIRGDTRSYDVQQFENIAGVIRVERISTRYKLVSKRYNPYRRVQVGGVLIGEGEKPFIVAGPCAIENKEHAFKTFEEIHPLIDAFRGMLYKPRTSPYEFQGLREEGLSILRELKKEFDKPIVQEVLTPSHIPVLYDYTDIFQIGARNMQNFELLKEVGRTRKPIILKRGMSSSLEDWLLAAEYIAFGGNNNIILCERGIKAAQSGEYSRNTADLAVIHAVKEQSCLPIIFDPSHSTGKHELVVNMSKAALSFGAHGLEIDVMPKGFDWKKLRCDAPQAITASELEEIVKAIKK